MTGQCSSAAGRKRVDIFTPAVKGIFMSPLLAFSQRAIAFKHLHNIIAEDKRTNHVASRTEAMSGPWEQLLRDRVGQAPEILNILRTKAKVQQIGCFEHLVMLVYRGSPWHITMFSPFIGVGNWRTAASATGEIDDDTSVVAVCGAYMPSSLWIEATTK